MGHAFLHYAQIIHTGKISCSDVPIVYQGALRHQCILGIVSLDCVLSYNSISQAISREVMVL